MESMDWQITKNKKVLEKYEILLYSTNRMERRDLIWVSMQIF